MLLFNPGLGGVFSAHCGVIDWCSAVPLGVHSESTLPDEVVCPHKVPTYIVVLGMYL